MKTVKFNLKPLLDRVVLKQEKDSKQTFGTIIIPDTAKEKPHQGEVVITGPGKVTDNGNLLPMEVKAGDKVLFAKYSGTEVKVGEIEYLIISEKDILAIIE